MRVALKIPEWHNEIQREYDSLIKNGIWKLVPLYKGSKILVNKWIFKTKLKANRALDKYKSKVVAKCFPQTEGVDYTKNFSPIFKPTTIRLCSI